MLLDLHTDFLGGRSGGLVFPSLKEFSRACCDPHKGFGIVNEEEVDVFLVRLAFSMIRQMCWVFVAALIFLELWQSGAALWLQELLLLVASLIAGHGL